MTEFGDTDSMLDKEGNVNDGNDEDNGNTTGHFTFNHYYNSTPGPSSDQCEMSTMNREGRIESTSETYIIDGNSMKYQE